MTEDPIVQCTACGAKMRLKAASVKVLKQVRCGKCQTMIEIPEHLKSGGPAPEAPVVPIVLPPPPMPAAQASAPVAPPAPALVSVVEPPAPAGLPQSVDKALVVRMEALEAKVNAQQESISLLTAQLRQIVKAQAAAVASAQAVLDR